MVFLVLQPTTFTIMNMGRRKDSSLVSYAEASTWAQSEYIDSRQQYWNWIDRERPAGLPKYPNRVYKEQWSSWNDFLSNDNEFANANPHQYRPYGEALQYAQASGIANSQEWFKGEHPEDIPVRPDLVYRSKGWLGWYSFLGTGPQAVAKKIAAAQQRVVDPGVLALVVNHGNPANVVHGFVGPSKEAVVERCRSNSMRLLKMFKMEEGFDWKAKMSQYGSSYGEDEWIMANVNELLWEMGNDLLFVN